jgi:glycosyltransferase involved in cell wall biosynthesis
MTDGPTVLVLGMGDVREQPGGLNRYVAELTSALRDVATVTVSPSTPLVQRLVAASREARRAARRADVVDAHFALYALWPVVAGSLRRQPLVVHVHGPWAAEGDDGRLVRMVKRRVERAVYERAARVVVLSDWMRDVVVGSYGVDPARVVVLPPGVDRDRFSPGPSERARLGVPGDRPLLLTVRRLVPRMGVDVLLRAVATLPSVHLAVVGDGAERRRLEQLARELDLADRVAFAGRVADTDLTAWYRSADVTVVPSVAHEGWGLVVDESLACGTPVVGSRLGGLPSALAVAPDALVPPGDADALARRLRGALDGTAPLPDAAACRAATAGRDWAAVAARTVALYRAAARPRVVVVGHCARPSGAELALLSLAPELAREVDLTVVLGEDGPVAQRLRQCGVPVDLLPLPGGLAARRRDDARVPPVGGAALHAARLAALLRRRRASVVHAWTLKAGLTAAPAARLAGMPLVWSARDRLAADYLPRRTAGLVRVAADRLADVVVANSAATLVTWSPQRARGTVVASPGVVRDAVPRRTGTPFTVACLSRLAPHKGQDLVVRAFARAFLDGEARLRVLGAAWFGEDDWASQLRGLATRLGVADRVDLVGHRDDVAAELAEVDVVVAYARVAEPFGQVVVDAMTAGRAVVAAAEGGPADTVTDGVDGLLVAPRDPVALAAALRRLHDDAELRGRLADGGVRTARRYRPERLAGELLAVYREVVR